MTDISKVLQDHYDTANEMVEMMIEDGLKENPTYPPHFRKGWSARRHEVWEIARDLGIRIEAKHLTYEVEEVT